MSKNLLSLAVAVLLFPLCAVAQTWSEQQLEVWSLIEESWAAYATGETGVAWLEEHLHPKFEGAGSLYPMPIGKKKLIEGMKHDRAITKSDFYVLEPQRIILHGDTAVVHYLNYWVYTTRATKGAAPTSGTRTRHQMAVFVRENGKWLQIASHGSDID